MFERVTFYDFAPMDSEKLESYTAFKLTGGSPATLVVFDHEQKQVRFVEAQSGSKAGQYSSFVPPAPPAPPAAQ